MIFHTKFAENKIKYLRQVNPLWRICEAWKKTYYRWQSQSILFEEPASKTFHFDLVLKSRRVLVNASRNIYLKLFDSPFRRCHGKLRFLVLFIKTKFVSMNRFIVPNLVNLWRFRKIRCKLSEIWEPKFDNIYKEMYARGGNRLLFKLYENQSNKLIIINQSTYCYSFTSLSNKTKQKILREPWLSFSNPSLGARGDSRVRDRVSYISCTIIQNASEILNMLLSIWCLVK